MPLFACTISLRYIYNNQYGSSRFAGGDLGQYLRLLYLVNLYNCKRKLLRFARVDLEHYLLSLYLFSLYNSERLISRFAGEIGNRVDPIPKCAAASDAARPLLLASWPSQTTCLASLQKQTFLLSFYA